MILMINGMFVAERVIDDVLMRRQKIGIRLSLSIPFLSLQMKVYKSILNRFPIYDGLEQLSFAMIMFLSQQKLSKRE